MAPLYDVQTLEFRPIQQHIMSTDPLHTESFPWQECRARLEDLLEHCSQIRVDARGRAFEVLDEESELRVRLRPPLLLPDVPLEGRLEDYLEEDLEEPGLQLMLLIQAGAVAMGLWEGEEILAHKAFKKYVVRGKGKAQATHLASKGKSRYGSRLRLQNWQSQILELKERCLDWQQSYGDFERVLVSCPVRLWPDLFASAPLPPFDQREGITRIPMDVAVPSHAELLRVRRACELGRIEYW